MNLQPQIGQQQFANHLAHSHNPLIIIKQSITMKSTKDMSNDLELQLKEQQQDKLRLLSYFQMLNTLQEQECPFFTSTPIMRYIAPVFAIFVGLSIQFLFGMFLVGVLPASFELWRGMVSIAFFFFALAFILIGRSYRFRRLGPIKYLRRQHAIIASLCGKQSCSAANSLVCIGLVYELLNEPENALQTFELVGTTFPVVSSSIRGNSLLQRAIGRVLTKLGRFAEALERLESSVHLAQLEPKSPTRLASDLHAIVAVHHKMGHPEKAIKWCQDAWGVVEKRGHGHVFEAVRCLLKVAATYEAMGDLTRALEAMEHALSIYLRNDGEFSSRAAVARLHIKIGALQVKMGQSGDDAFGEAIIVYRRGGMSDANPTMVDLLRKTEQPDQIV